MTGSTQIETIQKLLEPLLADDIFLVEIRIKPVNNIKIYLDADSGLAIEKCTKINRALYKLLEEGGYYPDGNYSLEVSSPGIDEPLKLHRQYVKNTGRELSVMLLDDIQKAGKLINVSENEITLEVKEGKNKKAVIKEEVIPFSTIKKAVVLIKF